MFNKSQEAGSMPFRKSSQEPSPKRYGGSSGQMITSTEMIQLTIEQCVQSVFKGIVDQLNDLRYEVQQIGSDVQSIKVNTKDLDSKLDDLSRRLEREDYRRNDGTILIENRSENPTSICRVTEQQPPSLPLNFGGTERRCD